MQPDWQQSFNGKWILCGEHSVLRGSGALVFPLKSKALTLKFKSSEQDLDIQASGLHSDQLPFIFSALFDKARELLQFEKSMLRGVLFIENEIPMGAGLGASATWCVAVTQFLLSQKVFIADAYEISKQLENLFHGESSGLDIAVVSKRSGLYFKRNGLREEIEFSRQPYLYLSTTEEKGLTRDCVAQVQNFVHANPVDGERIDAKMSACVEKAKAQISNEFRDSDLAEVISSAESCFKEWGLVTPAMEQHCLKLKEAGALASKPTGSGKGGYILSLWAAEPPAAVRSQLISVW